jgi:hypothetical protein
VDRIKYPENYDVNIRDFKQWMNQTGGNYGIWLGSNSTDYNVINCTVYNSSALTKPPEYTDIS